jgi:hypothetical protein
MVKEMKKMELHVTGTMMSNRIPQQIRIAKSSRCFRKMERGDHKMHLCEYQADGGNNSKMGLVCWKDKDIVY